MLKSEIYFVVVDEEVEKAILDSTGFTSGTLPIRYLGVPVINRRLSIEDCTVFYKSYSELYRTLDKQTPILCW